MAASGTTPAAAAWAACARPISCPDGVTTELSDMFWALNGATRTPRRASTRHRPATTVDLPALDVVPQTISAPWVRPAMFLDVSRVRVPVDRTTVSWLPDRHVLPAFQPRRAVTNRWESVPR